jgi:hypothetical protein
MIPRIAEAAINVVCTLAYVACVYLSLGLALRLLS